MRLVVDEAIAAGRQAFARFGDVVTVPGREIHGEDVSRAAALIVRSVTRVGRSLVAGSQLELVGSTTSGHDHVDLDALAARGIAFAYAPGCNATAVADWVVAVLAALHAERRHRFGGGTVGVVGAGHAGGRVARRLAGLGYAVRVCDPPRADAEGEAGFVDLATALASDVVSLHVPLTDDGPYPSRGLIGAGALAGIPAGSVLINAARGEIVDDDALATRLDDGPDLVTAIDTWAGEPAIAAELLTRVDLGTPHIAGNSGEGRLRGTAMVADAAARHFGVATGWDWRDALPGPPAAPGAGDPVEAVLAAYDPRVDDRRLRRLLQLPRSDRGAAFERIRAACGPRRELGAHAVAADTPAEVRATGLGTPEPADAELC